MAAAQEGAVARLEGAEEAGAAPVETQIAKVAAMDEWAEMVEVVKAGKMEGLEMMEAEEVAMEAEVATAGVVAGEGMGVEASAGDSPDDAVSAADLDGPVKACSCSSTTKRPRASPPGRRSLGLVPGHMGTRPHAQRRSVMGETPRHLRVQGRELCACHR